MAHYFKHPNIVLISIDSLRADHLSVYDYPKETTPCLARLVEDGVVFNRAISPAAWTGASVASLLTGLYPTSHGFTNAYYYLDSGIPTLPSMLAAQGYETVMFSNNIYIGTRTGLARDFHRVYYKGRRQKEEKESKNKSTRFASLPLSVRYVLRDAYDTIGPHRKLERDDGAAATEDALFAELDHLPASRPTFFYFHYQEPHSPYFPPYAYRKRFYPEALLGAYRCANFDHIGYYAGRTVFTEKDMQRYAALYDGEIAYLDWRLGRVFDYFKQKRLYEDTVFIVTADHGECFGENGYIWHAFCLYQGLIRVPLLIRFPRWFAKGLIINDLVQTHDIMPTLLEGVGAGLNYKNESQAQSFLSGSGRIAALTEYKNPENMVKRWLQRDSTLNRSQFEHYLRDLVAYQDSDAKVICASDGRHEYYDLSADPDELDNLVTHSTVDLMERCKSWLNKLPVHQPRDEQKAFDKTTWEKMKQLGYA